MTTSASPRLATVVIPVRNGAATIAQQLEALCDQASDCREVVIADNGSTDDTLAVVEGFRSRITNLRVIDARAARGVAQVRNHAAACTVGDLVWCDADDVVAPGWVLAMTTALDEYDLVGGRIDEHLLNGPRESPRTGQGDGLPVGWNYLPFAIGANMAVRRRVVDDIGGWDAQFNGAGEDIDLCWRAQLAGFRIGFAPDALVHYRHRRDPRELRAQQVRYGRAAAELHRIYRPLGMPRGPISGAARIWGKVVLLSLPALVDRRHRPTFQRVLGYAWGSTVGFVTERAWPH